MPRRILMPLSSESAVGIDGFVCDRAGARTYVNPRTGLIETLSANTAAFERQGLHCMGSDGYSQLLEYTEDFSEWTTIARVANAKDATGADGVANSATTITENNENSSHYVAQYLSGIVDSADYTGSIYVKRGSGSRNLRVYFVTMADDWKMANINLSDGTVYDASPGYTASVTAVGPYYRVSFSGNMGTGAATPKLVFFMTDVDYEIIYQGDSESSIVVFGANLTATPYPLPYAPADGSAVWVPGEQCSFDLPQVLMNMLSTAEPVADPTASAFSFFCEITYGYNSTDVSADSALVSVHTGAAPGLLYATTSGVASTDGTNVAALAQTWSAGDKVIYCVRGDSASGDLQVSMSDDNGATWSHGSAATYDGVMAMDDSLIYNANSALPAHYRWASFYDEWIPDARLTSAFYGGGGGMGMNMSMRM